MTDDEYLNCIYGAAVLWGTLLRADTNSLISVEPIYDAGIATNQLLVRFTDRPIEPGDRGLVVTVTIADGSELDDEDAVDYGPTIDEIASGGAAFDSTLLTDPPYSWENR